MPESIDGMKADIKKQLSQLIRTYSSLVSQLESYAYVDELTGLLNRRGILDALEAEISKAARKEEIVIIMMMDLNKFKIINDTLGHDAGDMLLQAISDRMREAFRREDKLGRLGGDEFMVVCEGVKSIDNVDIVTNKVENIFKEPFKGFEDFQVSNSIGVSIYPQHGTNTNILMKKADIAMYVAKESHTGHHVFLASTDKVVDR